MERDVRYLTVGLVVATLVAAFVGFAAWQAGRFDQQAGARYTLYVEGGVRGLSEGSAVRYRGVEVGRVISLRVSAEDPERIKVDIEVRSGTPVTAATEATIRPAGITGLSYVGLRTAAEAAPPPPEPPDEPYPVLHARASSMDRLMEEVPVLVERWSRVAGQAEDLLRPENRERVARILRRSDRLLTRLDTLAKEAAGLVAEAEGTLEGVDRTVGEAGESVRAARELVPKLDTSLTHLRSLSARLDRLVAANEGGLDRLAEKGPEELRRFLQEGRRALAEIKSLARSLEREPSRLLYRERSGGVEVPP